MAKIYSNTEAISKNLKPKKEIISFLLEYSKSLIIIKIKNKTFELMVN